MQLRAVTVIEVPISLEGTQTNDVLQVQVDDWRNDIFLIRYLIDGMNMENNSTAKIG